MMMLNWNATPKHTQAETDTHRYRVTYGNFESGQLHIWEFDDNAPYGKRIVLNRSFNSFIKAQQEAQGFADQV